jgi:anti-sigma regulatory factor (Ser/Thr protein kinase)
MGRDTVRPAGDAANRVDIPLPADSTAPRAARSFVRDNCPHLGGEVLDDITLIVSELVSNAVRHGRPEIALRMTVEPLSVDVSVLDHGTALPPAQATPAPDPTAASGRGLAIVESLASDWGVHPLETESGKCVWARLRVH